jgi:hypothetical protein
LSGLRPPSISFITATPVVGFEMLATRKRESALIGRGVRLFSEHVPLQGVNQTGQAARF